MSDASEAPKADLTAGAESEAPSADSTPRSDAHAAATHATPAGESHAPELDPRRGPEAPASSPDPKRRAEARSDRTIPLRKLVELAVKYPEIGPPLAELAFAIGADDFGDQLVRFGTDRETPQLEYWFVAANVARREKRYPDVLSMVGEALRTMAAQPESLAADEEERLLHLVRLGFATLMFDLKDMSGDQSFVAVAREALPALEPRLAKSPFFRTLLAQVLWFHDREASEREWDRAAEMDDPETTWNARGTWYNEAEHDPLKAEKTYRRGLEKAPHSALLMHNLAQILVEKARKPGLSPDEMRRFLNQATELLRSALRQDAPRLRRHIHATRDRLEELRRTLPAPERRGDRAPRHRDRGERGPRNGERREAAGRGPGGDRRDGGRGPGDRRDGGRGPGGERRDRDRGPGPGTRPGGRPPKPEQKFLHEGKLSLGEMIMAKLKEKER